MLDWPANSPDLNHQEENKKQETKNADELKDQPSLTAVRESRNLIYLFVAGTRLFRYFRKSSTFFKLMHFNWMHLSCNSTILSASRAAAEKLFNQHLFTRSYHGLYMCSAAASHFGALTIIPL